MGGGGGGGCNMGCIFVRENIRMQAAAHRRQALLRARRLGGIVERTHSPALSDPCAWLCVECGYLSVPATGIDDPMRRDATVVTPRPGQVCPGCGTRSWVDLSDVDAAQAIRDRESEVVASRSKSRLSAAVGVTGTAMGGALLLAGCPGVAEVMLVASLAVSGTVYFARALATRIGSDPLRARRWHRPRLTWRAGQKLASGTLGGTARLRAPLSGREGIAWVVTARGHGDDSRGLALAEQACGQIDIGGTALGTGLTLDVSPERIVNPSPEAVRWLLTRGITMAETTALFETVLCVGDEVEVWRDRKGGPPILRRR